VKIFVTKYFPLFWFAVIALVLWGLWGFDIVQASDDDCRYDCEPEVPAAEADASAAADADASADATAESVSESGSSATNQLAITQQRRAPNIYLHQTNQVEACGRVIGISGANTSGGWALGVPIPRSWTPTCDLWKATNEAQENGHVYTSYMFMCSIRAVRRVWTESTCQEFERMAESELFSMIGAAPAPPGPEASALYNQAAQSASFITAQVTQDDFEAAKEAAQEQHELVEYRAAQQQNKISSLEQNEAALRAEVERLQREAEARAAEREAKRKALEVSLSKYEAKKNES
jgi:cell division protein FtsB